MRHNRITTERLQAMLDHANARAQEEDRIYRASIRQELASRQAWAILAGITEPWEE